MKTLFCLASFSLAAIFLGGCSPHDSDLEARVQKLEAQYAKDIQTQKEIDRGFLQQIGDIQSNEAAFMMFTNKYENEDKIADFIGNAVRDSEIDNLSNSIIILESGHRPPRVTASTSQVNGVPADVYAQIKADAEKEWPGNYSMQANVIRWQIEHWKKLHGQ